MLAIGMIETKGLLPAIEASDVMLKAAEVHLLEKNLVGGGLVCIVIEGDVAAVQASVDAAAAAVETLGPALLISTHVIPRPDRSLDTIIGPLPEGPEPDDPEGEEPPEPEAPPEVPTPPESKAEEAPVEKTAETDAAALNRHLDETLQEALASPLNDKRKFDALAHMGAQTDLHKRLSEMRVVELRSLAREYDAFVLQGRNISRANKEQLLEAFMRHYEG